MITNYVPMDKWGKDHWSTLAYLETVAVENKGEVSNNRMRCNPRLHRNLANVSPMGSLIDGGQYPTRLKNDEKLDEHDDWSCVEDMVAEKLITVSIFQNRKSKNKLFGAYSAKIEFTAQGLKLAAQLRAHKASGGNFSNFEPKKEFV